MTPWLFLALTIGGVFLTLDAFRWHGSLRHSPFSVIAKLWPGELKHLPLHERDKIKKSFTSGLGMGELPWLFLIGTLVLAFLTVRAFLS